MNKPVKLSVDASQNGLGAVLLQDDLSVAYASRALTDTERKYAQIEKEALAICFGCHKFHQYIFGKSVTIESDHKPLESIFCKPINTCPARIQRMKLNVQKYDIKITYKPGKELLLADALSRAYLKESSPNLEEELEDQICLLETSLPLSINMKKEFIEETGKDDELQLLIKFINQGWPHDKNKLPEAIKGYHTYSNELSVSKGLVFKGERLIIPKSLRKLVLEKIHYAHLGIEKCKIRARESVYWPQMNKQIEDVVSNCVACNKFRKIKNKEPMILRDVPEGPWQTLGLDLFMFKGSEYLLVIDYFSKYVEVAKLTSTDSRTIVAILKSLFARFGIPNIIFSDNGPQLDCEEMKKFAKEWNFKHQTSSPYYPQSNGMAERHIQTIEDIFHKTEVDGRDPALALLEYRNTPIDRKICSPNELIFGRKIKGIMPVETNKNITTDYNVTKHLLEHKQNVQKHYYDYNAKLTKPVNKNDQVYVRIKPNKPLEPAKVIEQCDRPRSYRVTLNSNGKTYERNKKHMIVKRTSVDLRNNDSDVLKVTEQDHIDLDKTETDKANVDPKPNTDNHQPITFTRSGRTIKQPVTLKDYIT